MRRPPAVSLCIGLAVAGAVGPPTAQAAFPGRNGVLSVSYVFDCVGRVATLEPDGSPLQMLTSGTCAPPAALQFGPLGRASWSPDGRRLIFDHQVMHAPADPTQPTTTEVRFSIIKADGSARRDVPLLPGPPGPERIGSFYRSDPTFSADGERVIYTRQIWQPPVYPNEIWSADIDGGDERRLSAGGLPRVSPDGRLIAFVQSPGGAYDDVGASMRLISASTARPIRRLWRGSARSIDWSPDGHRLVFTGTPTVAGKPDVYVVRADGTGLRRLTSTAKASETDAVWSPDGRRIAFVREKPPRSRFRRYQIEQAIWTVRPDGTTERRIRKPWIRLPGDGKGQVRISWQPLPRP